MEHSPESWVVTREAQGDAFSIESATKTIAHVKTMREAEANARRIVACVNACDGIPTEVLESGYIAGVGTDEIIWIATNKLFGERKSSIEFAGDQEGGA